MEEASHSGGQHSRWGGRYKHTGGDQHSTCKRAQEWGISSLLPSLDCLKSLLTCHLGGETLEFWDPTRLTFEYNGTRT